MTLRTEATRVSNDQRLGVKPPINSTLPPENGVIKRVSVQKNNLISIPRQYQQPQAHELSQVDLTGNHQAWHELFVGSKRELALWSTGAVALIGLIGAAVYLGSN
jgi:hypothetical protein